MSAKETQNKSSNKNSKDKASKVETTGHSWDGIEELNTPMPRWWLGVFYGTIVFAIVWVILYPAIPLVHGATQGLLGYDSRLKSEADQQAIEEKNKVFDEQLIAAGFPEIAANEELYNYATQGGGAIFRTYCAQCHGAGAAGNPGYPSLIDDDWLWGGTYDDINYTITHGIRDEADPETRSSEMTPFGEVLSSAEIDSLVGYVRSLSGLQEAPADMQAAKTLFTDNCASCHTEAATGDREIGAPNLTDSVWLYGSDPATIRETIFYGRGNVMPHWSERLDPSQIKQIVVYVHSRGGGE